MKHNKNGLLHFLTVVVTIIVYLVIHVFCGRVRNDLLEEHYGYQNSIKKQPVNNITSIVKKDPPIDDNTDNNKTHEIVSISFAQDNISVKIGDTLRLIPEIKPVDLSSSKLTWKSSDSSIVSVDEKGNIKGLKEGTAIITVTSPNGKTTTIKITVESNEIKATDIILSPSKLLLKVGSSSQVSAIIKPENATNRELVWESSNTYVATVDENGIVKGISPGTTTITVKTKDGTVVSTITVIVELEVTPTPVPSDNIIFEYDYDKGNYIYLVNQFPIKDEVGKSLQGDKRTQDFKLKFNKAAAGVEYTITAEKLDESDFDDKWIKLFLVNDGSDVANCYRANNRVKSFDEYENYNNNPKEKILYKGVISGSEATRGYKDFTFRMWVSEDLELINSDYMSETKTYKTRINVYANGK